MAETRLPPQNLEAEMAVLGGLLLDNGAMGEVLEILAPDGSDFYRQGHKVVFQGILDLVSEGVLADIVTLSNALAGKNTLDRAGGYAYIGELADKAISAANIRHYCKIVKAKAIERHILAAAQMITEAVFDPAKDTRERLEIAQKTICDLTLERKTDTLQDAFCLAKATYTLIENRAASKIPPGLPCGFHSLDNLTGGLMPGEMTVLAARPGVGKTAFALNVAVNVAAQGKTVLVFSLEMPREQLMIRLMASMTGIDSRQIFRGLLTPAGWSGLTSATDRIARLPLFIDDDGAPTPAEIRAKARRVQAEHGLALVIVDYLQLLRTPIRYNTRQEAVAEFSRSMKALAKELHIPVVALSQLNRASELRGNRRPQMADLRESGAIEQDADVIIFLYRDELYNRADDNPEKGMVELSLSKHRNGPTGEIKLRFDPKTQTFRDNE